MGSFLLCLAFLIGPAFFIFGIQSPVLNPAIWLVTAFLPKKPVDTIPLTTHVVLFEFKESTTSFQIKDVLLLNAPVN